MCTVTLPVHRVIHQNQNTRTSNMTGKLENYSRFLFTCDLFPRHLSLISAKSFSWIFLGFWYVGQGDILELYSKSTVILQRKMAPPYRDENWYCGGKLQPVKKLILWRKWCHPLKTKIGSGRKTCGLNTVTARPKFSPRLGLVPGTT